jgi:predicted PurR-regulated permease PerM
MNEIKFPFYAKLAFVLISITIIMGMIYIAQSIILPFAFAVILTILLDPVNQFLQRKKLPSLLAITITVVCAIVIVGLLFYFITTQLSLISAAFPQFKVRIMSLISDLQAWMENTFHITSDKQTGYIKQAGQNIFQSGGAILGTALSTISGVLVVFTLLPVYVFVLLIYKPLFVNFLKQVFTKKSGTSVQTVSNILEQIKMVIQSYLVGLLIEASIVATLNSVGLLLLGIDYAILLGVLGAILNIIPYIGGLIAITLPVLIALATKDGFGYPLGVVLVYLFIQFVDNNIIVPKVVASKVKINAVISILAVLAGGALAGVAGMFLSIPMVAILKVIFDRIDDLQPWGALLGDDMPEQHGKKFNDNKPEN